MPQTTMFAPGLLSLAREIGETKRVRSAARSGSIATRLFLDAWDDLLDGATTEAAMGRSLRAALRATRLGDLDRACLLEHGVSPDDIEAVFADALRAFGTVVPASLLAPSEPPARRHARVPAFATALASQPRAGITAPGRARIVLEPQENHAEHCLAVAVMGVLFSSGLGADPSTVWLAGLAHHLHNASMPDSGFAGEMLLGAHLEPMMARAREAALGALPPDLARRVRDALAVLPDADTPEGRAFHAADTLDRVWQIEQHLRVGTLRLDTVLGEMELVHAGPVRPFQERVLREAGLPV